MAKKNQRAAAPQSLDEGKRWTAAELRDYPTLSVGQADDLKVEGRFVRVWLSRCTVADGEPYNNKITVEELVNGCWETKEEYEG